MSATRGDRTQCDCCGDTTWRGRRTESGGVVCPLCGEFYDRLKPELAVEKVVIFPTTSRDNSRVAHLPDGDGEPVCGKRITDRSNQNMGRDRATYLKDYSLLPWHRLCKHCLRTTDLRAFVGGGVDGGRP